MIGLAVCACVAGYRGLVEFYGDENVGAVSTVRIELPDTPVPVVACATSGVTLEHCASYLEYEGFWRSIAGTAKDAEANVLDPGLEFEIENDVGMLQARIPVELEDLVDLELTEVRLPYDRDLEILTGLGDVAVAGLEGALMVDVEVGNINVDCGVTQEQCGAGGVAAETGHGKIKVYTRGNADLRSGNGSIELYQYGQSERDVYIHTGSGDVLVELAADANLDLHVHGGTISVQTTQIDTYCHGSFHREVGNGTHLVEIFADWGDVEIRLAG